MVKIVKVLLLGFIALGFYGCAVKTDDIRVTAAKCKKADLSGYKTYQVLDGSGIMKSSRKTRVPKNIDIDAEIRNIIESELAKKGKRLVAANPDFYIGYVAGADIDALKSKVNDKGEKALDDIPMAAIAMLFVDASTGAVVCLSYAEGEMRDLPVDQKRKRLKYAVKKMLQSL